MQKFFFIDYSNKIHVFFYTNCSVEDLATSVVHLPKYFKKRLNRAMGATLPVSQIDGDYMIWIKESKDNRGTLLHETVHLVTLILEYKNNQISVPQTRRTDLKEIDEARAHYTEYLFRSFCKILEI